MRSLAAEHKPPMPAPTIITDFLLVFFAMIKISYQKFASIIRTMNFDFVYSQFFYISILLFSIVGILFADWHYKLAFFLNAKASILAIGLSMILLLSFDVAGIFLGIFTTNRNYVSGWYFLTPNLPLEEFAFLFLLGYVTLVVYQLVGTLLSAQTNGVENKK